MRSLILLIVIFLTIGCKSSEVGLNDLNEVLVQLDAINARLDAIVMADAIEVAKIETVVNDFYTEFKVYRELTGSIQMRQAKRLQREAGRNIERMQREIAQ